MELRDPRIGHARDRSSVTVPSSRHRRFVRRWNRWAFSSQAAHTWLSSEGVGNPSRRELSRCWRGAQARRIRRPFIFPERMQRRFSHPPSDAGV